MLTPIPLYFRTEIGGQLQDGGRGRRGLELVRQLLHIITGYQVRIFESLNPDLNPHFWNNIEQEKIRANVGYLTNRKLKKGGEELKSWIRFIYIYLI